MGPASSSFLEPQAEAVGLFEVEADDAEFWRLTSLDRFDGESWSTDLNRSEGAMSLSAPASLPRADEGLPLEAETLVQTFHILSDLDFSWIPMAQTAEEITGPIGDFTWDPARSQALIDGGLEAGTEYTVRSRIVVPTPEELDQVDHLAPRAYGQWTELPADLDPRIGRIAGAVDGRCHVGLSQGPGHPGALPERTFRLQHRHRPGVGLLEFLTQTRTGFCQQYSSAMAVMVRTLGMPSRIGVGFRAGTRQEDGSYLVTSEDVHVWVEVLFPGYGWLQFEPEAGTDHPNARAGTYLNPVPTEAS